MSFCQTCGSSLPEGTVACPACGASQGPAAGPPAAAAPGPYAGYVPVAAPLPAAGAGLTPNVAGALAYVLGLITGILFLVIDPFKNDPFVRFHAFQAILLHVAFIAITIVWSIIGVTLGAVSHGLFLIISFPVHMLIWLVGFCVWVYSMFSAFQGKMLQLPVIGPIAARQAGSVTGVGQRL